MKYEECSVKLYIQIDLKKTKKYGTIDDLNSNYY